MLLIFQQMTLPETVFEQDHIPAELTKLVEVVENPPVYRISTVSPGLILCRCEVSGPSGTLMEPAQPETTKPRHF